MVNRKTKNVGNEIKAPKVKPLPMIRINSRIEPRQHKFIKAQVGKIGNTEGEVLRNIISSYIKNNK